MKKLTRNKFELFNVNREDRGYYYILRSMESTSRKDEEWVVLEEKQRDL